MVEDKRRRTVIEEFTASATVSLSLATGPIWKSTLRIRNWEQLPKDHPIYNAIGRVASDWAYYELILDDIIRSLVGVSGDLVTSITAQMMGINNRLNAIKALCIVQNISKKTQEKIDSIRNNSFIPLENRNRIVHDPWFLDPITSETAQFKSMPAKEMKYGVKPVDAKFIDDTLKMIADRITEASKFHERILDELVTLNKRLPEPKFLNRQDKAP